MLRQSTDRPLTVTIGPLNIDRITESQLVEQVRLGWRARTGGSVITANVDILRAVAATPSLEKIVGSASYVVADGMPVVWASKVSGQPVPERVTGASLVHSLSGAAAADGRTVFLLGGAAGVPELAASALSSEFPCLKVCGTYSPPFGFDRSTTEIEAVVQRVVAASPDLVLVGLGFPRQELIIEQIRKHLPRAWYLGCGAGIPMAAGVFRRAPYWIQSRGMEWFYRLVQEPRRLAGRYLRNDLPFAARLIVRAGWMRIVRAIYPPSSDVPGYICFSAQDWWYHNQSHSDFQLMRSLAGHRTVLVVNSIGMRMPVPGRGKHVARRIGRKIRSIAKLVRRPIASLPNFVVMTPLSVPLYSNPVTRQLNAALIRLQVTAVARFLGIRDPVVVATLPTAWDVVRPMRRRSLLFNRSDRHSEFPGVSRTAIRDMERSLLAESDHVLYVSRALLDDERELTGSRAHFLDHGVDLDHFNCVDRVSPPEDILAIPGPRLGFFGALEDYLVDFSLLERLARDLPDASVVLIGDAPDSISRFRGYPNVHFLGFRSYETIPAYGSAFDVALMPWVDSPWIESSNPIKLKEYLALGLPVVSTPYAEVRFYADHVRVAKDPEQFVGEVRRTLSDGGPTSRLARRAAVLSYSWSSRAECLRRLAESPTPPELEA